MKFVNFFLVCSSCKRVHKKTKNLIAVKSSRINSSKSSGIKKIYVEVEQNYFFFWYKKSEHHRLVVGGD